MSFCHGDNQPLARDVRRNQEQQKRARLLRPYLTLVNLLQELHTFSNQRVKNNPSQDATKDSDKHSVIW